MTSGGDAWGRTGAWVVSSRIGAVEAALTQHEIAASDRFGKLETAMSDRVLLEGLDITVTPRSISR